MVVMRRLLMCFSVACIVGVVEMQENIALRQASFQAGTYRVGFSSRAVDGSRNPVYTDGSCTHSIRDAYPWWAVDLGWRRHISHVSVTNRLKSWDRLLNMTLGVTDDHPYVTRPYPDNLDVCYFRIMPIGSAETLTVPCNVTGRYFVVSMDTYIALALTLCEVEVYEVQEDPAPTTTTPAPRPDLPYNYRPSLTHQEQLTVCYLDSLSPEERQTVRDCFRECFLNPCCMAVNLSSCEQSYVKTELLHYVKEGLSTEPQESCSFPQPAVESRLDGTPFSFFDVYAAMDSAITNITVFYEVDEGMKGLSVTYAGESSEGRVAGFRSDLRHDCALEPGERIEAVTTYEGYTQGQLVVHGLTLHTTRQTCGVMGQQRTDNVLQAAGHQLLFISGRARDQITSLAMHFDY